MTALRFSDIVSLLLMLQKSKLSVTVVHTPFSPKAQLPQLSGN